MDHSAIPIVGANAARRFFAPLLSEFDHEHSVAAHLDASGRLLGVSEASGTASSIALPVRRLARDALIQDARFLLLAHNHPSGDPRPSKGDIDTTRRLARLLKLLDIRLYDHLILTRQGDYTSFRELGWL